MSRAVLERLADAREFAGHASDHAAGSSVEHLEGAAQQRQAALYAIAVIGEALGKVPGDIRNLAPDLPWAAIVTTRNIIVHGYWQVDLKIIVDIVENWLQPLIGSLDRLIGLVRQAEA